MTGNGKLFRMDVDPNDVPASCPGCGYTPNVTGDAAIGLMLRHVVANDLYRSMKNGARVVDWTKPHGDMYATSVVVPEPGQEVAPVEDVVQDAASTSVLEVVATSVPLDAIAPAPLTAEFHPAPVLRLRPDPRKQHKLLWDVGAAAFFIISALIVAVEAYGVRYRLLPALFPDWR